MALTYHICEFFGFFLQSYVHSNNLLFAHLDNITWAHLEFSQRWLWRRATPETQPRTEAPAAAGKLPLWKLKAATQIHLEGAGNMEEQNPRSEVQYNFFFPSFYRIDLLVFVLQLTVNKLSRATGSVFHRNARKANRCPYSANVEKTQLQLWCFIK